jgi:cytochrome c oxidase subunit 3
VHGIHVFGGIVALTILLAQALRGRILPAHTEYVGLYWHCVDLVWIFLFPLLYLI